MKKNISSLKLNLIIILFLWSVSGVLGVLNSFELKDWIFYSLIIILTAFSAVFLYKRYQPFTKSCCLNPSFAEVGNINIYRDHILGLYEITPLEKLLFTIKSPGYDYSNSFSSKGLVIKTLYDSYLIDDAELDFAHDKRVRIIKNANVNYVLLCILYLFPAAAPLLSFYLKIDPLIYVCIMVIIIFLAAMRVLPPFYLGSKISYDRLPLSQQEYDRFKGITIIEGFIMSDKLSIIPFIKSSYLEGLAVDIIIKKYIVINPRLFALDSEDYLRFVLFHELSHIRHHDGSGSIIIPILIVLMDTVFSLLPAGFRQRVPYWDYILLSIATVYFICAILKSKRMEKRADLDGISCIGDEGAANIKMSLGYDIKKMI